jgi:hypothetical protein
METVMIKKSTARAVDRITEMIASLLMRSAIKPIPSVDEQFPVGYQIPRSDVIACLSSPITTDLAEFFTSRAKPRRRIVETETARRAQRLTHDQSIRQTR